MIMTTASKISAPARSLVNRQKLDKKLQACLVSGRQPNFDDMLNFNFLTSNGVHMEVGVLLKVRGNELTILTLGAGGLSRSTKVVRFFDRDSILIQIDNGSADEPIYSPFRNFLGSKCPDDQWQCLMKKMYAAFFGEDSDPLPRPPRKSKNNV